MGWQAAQGDPLTKRERQVLDLLVSLGASNKVLANELGISSHTAKMHLKSICVKLGLGNRVQCAVYWAVTQTLAKLGVAPEEQRGASA